MYVSYSSPDGRCVMPDDLAAAVNIFRDAGNDRHADRLEFLRDNMEDGDMPIDGKSAVLMANFMTANDAFQPKKCKLCGGWLCLPGDCVWPDERGHDF